jgi:hypothetical protein
MPSFLTPSMRHRVVPSLRSPACQRRSVIQPMTSSARNPACRRSSKCSVRLPSRPALRSSTSYSQSVSSSMNSARCRCAFVSSQPIPSSSKSPVCCRLRLCVKPAHTQLVQELRMLSLATQPRLRFPSVCCSGSSRTSRTPSRPLNAVSTSAVTAFVSKSATLSFVLTYSTTASPISMRSGTK